MLFSIYKTIDKVFNPILHMYGFEYSGYLKHNVIPKVEYRKGGRTLIIGYSYEESRPIVFYRGKEITDPSFMNLERSLTVEKKLIVCCCFVYEYLKNIYN